MKNKFLVLTAIAVMSFIAVPTAKAQYYYAHLGGTCNTISTGYGGSFEIGAKTDEAITLKRFIKFKGLYEFWELFDLKCGIIAEYGQAFEGSGYNALSAAIKPGVIFYPLSKTAFSFGPSVGFVEYMQKGQAENINWKSTQYIPFIGAFVEASYMFSKTFGFFTNVSYGYTRYSRTGFSVDNGTVYRLTKEEKIGISSTRIGLGFRVEF